MAITTWMPSSPTAHPPTDPPNLGVAFGNGAGSFGVVTNYPMPNSSPIATLAGGQTSAPLVAAIVVIVILVLAADVPETRYPSLLG